MLDALAAPLAPPPAPSAPAPSPNANQAAHPAPATPPPKPDSKLIATESTKSGFDSDFEELQRIASGGEDGDPAKTEPVKAGEPDGGPAKEPEKKVDAELPDKKPDSKGWAEFRKAYQETKASLENTRKEYEELKTKASRPSEPDPELSKIRETLAQREKRIAEYEQEMRYVNYEKSQEYQEKFEQPKQKLLNDARDTIQELVRTESDGTERAGTWKDFQDILLMEPMEASKTAKEWFGDAALEVLAFRREYRKLNSERSGTMERYQREAVELEAQRTAKQQEHRANIQKLWTDSNSDIVKKFGQFFAPVEGDDEGNKLLAQGFEKADAAFMQINGAKPEELVKLHSEVRNMAAGFGRQVLFNKRLTKENADLKEKLKQFETSVPRNGDGGDRATAKDSIDDDLKWAQSTPAR